MIFEDQPPVLIAALTGFVSGLVISVLPGPINLTIINDGARCGFRWALLIGLGAVAMELVYCTIAFTGFASFFERGVVKAAMELTSFVFLIFLGLKFLTARSVEKPGRIETRVTERLHPRSAFATGFVRVLGNPGVLLFWIVLAANFISRDWVNTDFSGTREACIAGVAAGAGLWFVCLSYVVSLRHLTVSEKFLLRLEQFSGMALLVIAAYHGATIIREMVSQHHHRLQ